MTRLSSPVGPARRSLAAAICLVLSFDLAATCSFNSQACHHDTPTEEHTCSSVPIELDAASSVSQTGSLECDTATLAPYCGAGGDAQAIYRLTPRKAGTVHVVVDDVYGATLFVYREKCGAPTKGVACRRDASELYFPVVANVEYDVAIHGFPSGPFRITFTIDDKPQCGNGVVEKPEQCDFGAAEAGVNGCTSGCSFAVHGATEQMTDTCPGGDTYSLALHQPRTVTGYTTNFSDDFHACGALRGGPDRVFTFRPIVSGDLTASLTASFDAVLSAYEGPACVALDTKPPTYVLDGLLSCSDRSPGGLESFKIVGAKAQTEYFIVVDGYTSKDFGAFSLTVDLE